MRCTHNAGSLVRSVLRPDVLIAEDFLKKVGGLAGHFQHAKPAVQVSGEQCFLFRFCRLGLLHARKGLCARSVAGMGSDCIEAPRAGLARHFGQVPGSAVHPGSKRITALCTLAPER